jgi:flagellar biosynthesis component FlhA
MLNTQKVLKNIIAQLGAVKKRTEKTLAFAIMSEKKAEAKKAADEKKAAAKAKKTKPVIEKAEKTVKKPVKLIKKAKKEKTEILDKAVKAARKKKAAEITEQAPAQVQPEGNTNT